MLKVEAMVTCCKQRLREGMRKYSTDAAGERG